MEWNKQLWNIKWNGEWNGICNHVVFYVHHQYSSISNIQANRATPTLGHVSGCGKMVMNFLWT